MKKNKILLLFAILLTILFILSFFVEFNEIQLKSVWFAVAMLFIGLYAIMYYLLYNLDSSLYYGSLLVFCAISNFFQNIYAYNVTYFYLIYILCFALASLAVFVIFRQNIHFKLFAILLLESILLVGYKMNYLSVWQVVFLNVTYLIIILIRAMFRIRKNLRRVK